MRYEYKVLRETEIRNLEPQFNALAREGYRVISVVWDYDESCFVAILEKMECGHK